VECTSERGFYVGRVISSLTWHLGADPVLRVPLIARGDANINLHNFTDVINFRIMVLNWGTCTPRGYFRYI
jgi:hypothetical protein